MTALAVLVAAALAGCTAGTGPQPSASPTAARTSAPPPSAAPFRAAAPTGPALVLDVADPVQAAVAASRALYVAAPVVVLAPVGDGAAQLTAASAAVALGAPVLLTPPATASSTTAPATPAASPGATEPPGDLDPGVTAELARLGAAAVVAVGTVPAPPVPVVVRVPAAADAATLARALGTGHGPNLAAGPPVAAGSEAAAVIALARPGTAVLRAAGAAAGATPDATGAPPTPADVASPPAAVPGTAATPVSSGGRAVGPAPGATAGLRLSSPGSAASALPRTVPPTKPPGTVALVGAGAVPLAVLATVRAAGLPVIDVPAADPRATSSAVQALAHAKPAHVVALGTGFGPAGRLAERVAAAATGVELPGGGQLYFPQDEGLAGKRYVALYGSPGMPALGVLGEQDVPATIARAQAHAAPYRALTPDTVVAGVEIIATIASAGAGADGNYSTERPVADLLPLVQAAGAAGMTVVLDLQPGRTDFLTQAQEYESLLDLPYVSLALDPEWRLGPNQVHLKQIGHVGVDEVNAVAAWLAQLVAAHHLPQKALVLHEFALSMITDRDRLDTSHDELAVVIHVDGQGSQPAKVGTWNAIRQGAPAGVHWGWKNFYDEDTPAMLDPAGTYAIQPTPDLVTYQ